MMPLKVIVAIIGSVIAIPIICGLMGKPQSYFEQHGHETAAIAIGLSAGVFGFSLTRLLE